MGRGGRAGKKENLPSARILGMEALTSRSGGAIGKAVGWILKAHFLSLLVGGLGQTLGPSEVKSTRGRELKGA